MLEWADRAYDQNQSVSLSEGKPLRPQNLFSYEKWFPLKGTVRGFFGSYTIKLCDLAEHSPLPSCWFHFLHRRRIICLLKCHSAPGTSAKLSKVEKKGHTIDRQSERARTRCFFKCRCTLRKTQFLNWAATHWSPELHTTTHWWI